MYLKNHFEISLLFMLVSLLSVQPSFGFQENSGDEYSEPMQSGMAATGWLEVWDGATTFGWRNTASTRIVEENDDKVWVLSAEPSVVRTGCEFYAYRLILIYELKPGSRAELLLNTNTVARFDGEDHRSVPLESGEETMVATAMVTDDGTVEFRSNRLEADRERILESVSLPQRGYLGLRVLEGELRVRAMRLLPYCSRQQMEALENWDDRGLGEAQVGFENGSLQLGGGPGYLVYRDGEPSNFLLQFQARSTPETNSGVFFRCIPGEAMNGYECQINNQMVDGDPQKPADCGTGGIFRRADARRIVAQPDDWFTVTIIASGANTSTWVDGYRTADWSDLRPTDSNPRKGRRTAGGELQLQAHDPATDIQFREMKLSEYPEQR